MLRLIDVKTDKPILTRAEALELQKQRADLEKQRADLLAAEVERLKKQLGRSGA